MAKLTTKARKALSGDVFAFPKERKYPLDTMNRARNALARGSQFASPEQLATIRRKVHAKYPGIKMKKK